MSIRPKLGLEYGEYTWMLKTTGMDKRVRDLEISEELIIKFIDDLYARRMEWKRELDRKYKGKEV